MSEEQYVRYDYAWKTPGWSVQNPTFNYESDGYLAPGLPDDVAYVRVFYNPLELDTGRTLEGVLRLRVDKMLVHTPTGRQVMPGGWRPYRFRKSRGLSIYLPATDDPQLVAFGGGAWKYEAKLTVRGVVQEFTFALPSDLDEVNLVNLITPPALGIDIGQEDGGFTLGSTPLALTVNLTTGADFVTTINLSTDWAPDSQVRLELGDVVWVAFVDGTAATFDIDKTVADTIPDGTTARLIVQEGDDDQVWAVGKVVRHG